MIRGSSTWQICVGGSPLRGLEVRPCGQRLMPCAPVADSARVNRFMHTTLAVAVRVEGPVGNQVCRPLAAAVRVKYQMNSCTSSSCREDFRLQAVANPHFQAVVGAHTLAKVSSARAMIRFDQGDAMVQLQTGDVPVECRFTSIPVT